MNNIQHKPVDQLRQPLTGMNIKSVDMPRYERWGRAVAEIDALPHTLPLYEFKAAQQEIWGRWGL